MARVLLVDDNTDHRELMGVALRKGGHHVVDAGNGEIAIASVKTSPRFDIAIVDMYMPVKDGIETIRELRRESSPPGHYRGLGRRPRDRPADSPKPDRIRGPRRREGGGRRRNGGQAVRPEDHHPARRGARRSRRPAALIAPPAPAKN